MDSPTRPLHRPLLGGRRVGELSSRLLTVIEPAKRRHAIAVDTMMMPRAVSRLRNALRRHGWPPPDPSLTSWPESSVILRLVLIAATSA